MQRHYLDNFDLHWEQLPRAYEEAAIFGNGEQASISDDQKREPASFTHAPEPVRCEESGQLMHSAWGSTDKVTK